MPIRRQRLSLWILSLFCLLSCQSQAPQGLSPHDFFTKHPNESFVFFAMGTEFKIQFLSPPQVSLEKTQLEAQLGKLIRDYDETFSDWNEESELRKLEKAGLKSDIPLRSSYLFFEGLELASQAFLATNGLFDISIGAVIWKERSRATGLTTLKLNKNDKSFLFGVDPVRLSFGGLAKGMLSGALALVLQKNGIENFWISAGGGNEVFSGSLHETVPSVGRMLPRARLHFVSHSASFQKSTQHIFDPRNPRRVFKRKSTVICSSDSDRDAIALGAMADAFSTSLSIEDQKIPARFPCLSSTSEIRDSQN